MEEIEPERKFLMVNTVLITVALAILAIGLVVQMTLATRSAGMVEGDAEKHLLLQVRMSLLLLAFDLVVLFWLTIRYLASRSRRRRIPNSAAYVDAWTEAGQRFQLEEEEENDD